MAYFFVLLHGQGISIPSTESGEDLIGFYTTRWVKARDVDEAATIAITMVMADWTKGEYAGLNRADPPTLSVDETTKVGLLRLLRRQPGAGYTFYSSE